MHPLYPLLFQPNLYPVIWGGRKLKPWKGMVADDEPIGESWEVSAVPSCASIVTNGTFAGRPLDEVVKELPKEILGERVAALYADRFPLLVKFIDAERDLSIQVHPNDEMAMREHGKMGKTEMWYVIDAKPGAYLYAGFKEEVTSQEYKRRVADGSITEVLARHEVKPGDVFYLPAGRVHAICGGILLAEIQQSSDVTYRIFDYNRRDRDGKLRELHTELADRALDFKVEREYRTDYTARKNEVCLIKESPFFTVNMLELDCGMQRELRGMDSFIIYMCVEGSCSIGVQENGERVRLTAGNSCLIPAAIAHCDIVPDGMCRVLETYIKSEAPLNPPKEGGK